MREFKKYTVFAVALVLVYSAALYFIGYFNIGLLSDDYLNFYDALNSTLYGKITGSLPFTNAFHIRPFYYLSLEKSVNIHDLLGFSPDSFAWYRFQNLVIFVLLAYTAGCTVLHLTKRVSLSLAALAAVLLYTNNINNICWTAARVDLICCFFYILAIYSYLLHYDYRKRIFLVLTVFSVTAALLTKELAVTLPFTLLILTYFFHGKIGLKRQLRVLIVIFIPLLLYFVLRVLILGNNVIEIATIYQENPLSNAPGVFARALISLSIPLDYQTMNYLLRNDNKIVLLYLFILYGAGFYFIWVMVKTDIFKFIMQLLSLFLLIVIPYAVVGYIRPQMILLPFVIITIHILWIYGIQRKLSNRLNKKVLRVLFGIALVFWSYWSYTAVNDWQTSYNKSRTNVDNLLKQNFEPGKRIILIGNPGRYKQTFLFDKMTGAYNFWKHRAFVVNDTINDIVQTAAMEESSIGAKFDLKKINEREFEIR
ncbi:MAG: hypothetical protein K8I03_15975, partial [Ignavibacteria bacterium]|nr:hypothetical protein [Ignavibacteria bacterium]